MFETTSSRFVIGGRAVGVSAPCLIIAEAGVNHNGKLDIALRLIDEAARCGVDVVKFQIFRTDEVVNKTAPMAAYQERNTGRKESQYDMIRRLELAPEDFARLKAHCEELGVIFMCSPFDIPSVDVLIDLDVTSFKVASGEITNFPLLRRIGAAHKPVILSTGMSTLEEVGEGLACLDEFKIDVALLHAISLYPTPPQDVNLRAMTTLADEFARVTGFSDHTLGTSIPIAAVARGAKIIEKHFTLDKKMEGPDHKASLDIPELGVLVRSIRDIEAALGSAEKCPTAAEEDTRRVARKSLVILRDLDRGAVLREGDIGIKRPGTGLPPSLYECVLGKRLAKPVLAGALLSAEDMDES